MKNRKLKHKLLKIFQEFFVFLMNQVITYESWINTKISLSAIVFYFIFE